MIHLRQIEVFYAIMRTGSVTDAARVLNVTQPAVSAALKQFESRLRMKLFERRGGKLQPTSEAKALLPEVKEIFDRLLAVERFSQDLAGGMRDFAQGKVCVGDCLSGMLSPIAIFVDHLRPAL